MFGILLAHSAQFKKNLRSVRVVAWGICMYLGSDAHLSEMGG